MGFLDIFKPQKPSAPKPQQPITIAAEAKGVIVPMEKIPDEVFAQGILGKACAIWPSEGKIYAPLDGEVTQIPETLHAIGLQGDSGAEVLVHAGVDTVAMKGDGFTCMVKTGDKVKAGQLLMEVNLAKVRAAGHHDVVVTVITNSDAYTSIERVADGNVAPGDPMLILKS